MKKRHRNLLLAAVVLVFPLLVTACGGKSASEDAEPAVVEQVAGSNVQRIVLTAETAKRLEVRTATVQQDGADTAIPYAAVLYSASGNASAYVNSAPLTFVREAIVVDRIVGNRALLSKGPSVGTKVATVGVPELWGIESGAGVQG